MGQKYDKISLAQIRQTPMRVKANHKPHDRNKRGGTHHIASRARITPHPDKTQSGTKTDNMVRSAVARE